MALKDLQVNIGADTTGFNRGVKDVQKGVGGIGKSLSALRLKTVAITAAITAMAMSSVKLMKAYAGLRNSVQRTNELFRESNKYIEYFANNTARAFGMSETTAYQYAMTYGNLFKGITKSTEENAKVTIAMMKASAVIASKTGRTMEDVNERIRSGILGNTEAIEDLGINVPIAMIKTTNAFKQIADGRPWESLTYQEQQQIRVLAILEQSTSQYGDSVSQISGMSLPRLGQAFKDLMSYAGMFVTKALQPIINALGKIIIFATQALKSLSNMLGWDLAGGVKPAEEAIQSSAGGFSDMSDDAKKTAKSAKEIRKNLMGFDELNVLSPTKADGGAELGGVGSTGSPTAFDGIAMPEFSELEMPSINTSKFEGAFETIKKTISKLTTSFKKLFAPSIESISDAFGKLKKPVTNAFKSVNETIKKTWTGTFKPFASYALGNFIPSIVNGFTTTFAPIFSSILKTAIEQFALDFQFICQGISSYATDILQPALERVKTVATDVFDSIKTTWDERGASILQGFTDFKESLREIWESIYDKIIKPVVDNMGKKFDWLWDKHLKGLWDNIVSFIGSVGEFLLALWNNVLGPYINYLIDVWAPYFKSVFNTVSDVVSTVVGIISDFIGGLLQTLRGVLDFLTGVFTGDWDKAWQGIKDIYEGVMDALEGIAKGAVNLVIDVINGLINGVWAGIRGIVNGVGGIVEKIGDALGKDWELTVPENAPNIPKLARGGLATAPTIAMVGDNKNARIDPEVIAPLSKLEDMIGNKLMQIMQINQMSPAGAGYTGDITIQCILDEREIGRALVKYQNGQQIKSNRRG